MAAKPAISVIMPVYNAEAFLHQAIESILTQTFADFELLIIDDGSTDGSKTIIEQFQDNRIRLITHQKNKGLIESLNEAITLSQAELIARMDADDVSLPERLQQQYAFMQHHPETVAVGTEAQVIDVANNWLYDQTCLHTHESLHRLLAVCSPFIHGSVMFRKTAVEAVGGYRSESYTAEDYDLWLRLRSVGEIANLSQMLYQWRVNPASESHVKAKKQRQMMRKLADRHWKTFPPEGPAPLPSWQLIWPAEEIRREPKDERRRQLAHFHIYFARSYRRHGNYWLGWAHLVAAWWLRPLSVPFYFYYLCLPLLPIKQFLALEEWLLDLRMRSTV